jgi:hypothetical protein
VVKHTFVQFVIINGIAQCRHDLINIRPYLSYYSMATCFDHVTVILRATFSTKIYTIK